MSVSAPPTFKAQAHVVFAQVGEESVLLNTVSGRYFGLDPIGTRIWMRLAEGATLEQICADLITEYDVEPGELRGDVARILEQLESGGLIAASAALSVG